MKSHKSGLIKDKADFPSRYRYETFRSVLRKNSTVLQSMADLEADLNFMRQSNILIRNPVNRLVDESFLMVQELNILTGDRYKKLYDAVEAIRQKIFSTFKTDTTSTARPLAVLIDSEDIMDSSLVGGKSFGLAALRRYFPTLVPPAFTLTTEAYLMFVKENGLNERIRMLINDLDVIKDQDLFNSRVETLRSLFLKGTVPKAVCNLISKHALQIDTENSMLWAVRSSAACEDDLFTFAGQFDTELNVCASDLKSVYKKILAGRFTDRAVGYRIHHGIREVDTHMAVLFMPMIETDFSGVIYTNDPLNSASECMLVNAVPGLAHEMIQGKKEADMFSLSREESPGLLNETQALDSESRQPVYSTHPSESVLKEIAGVSFKLAKMFGHDMDIEWAVGKDDKIWLLQGRKLQISETEKKPKAGARRKNIPVLEGGATIFPGRAVGPVEYLKEEDKLILEQKGAILIVKQASLKLASILPDIGALILEKGNPVGHLATLARELSVPCLFKVGEGIRLFKPGEILSIDATTRKIYKGSQWDDVRARVLARINAGKKRISSGPLYDLVLKLNLIDPNSSNFKPKKCSSVHDVIRFIHEMSVRSMFSFGDSQNRLWRRNAAFLKTPIPIKIKLLDLDGLVEEEKEGLIPLHVKSIPFQALWKGISDPRVVWHKRTIEGTSFLPPAFEEEIMGGRKGPRGRKDTNYFIVAKDYLNFNARFVYHYALIDAVTGPWPENNYVNFRFRGGASNREGLNLRALFLESVLRLSNFEVDRKGDLVTSWFRYNSQKDSESALEMLGRLMACSRQLDMLLTNDEMVKTYVDNFVSENFRAFA